MYSIEDIQMAQDVIVDQLRKRKYNEVTIDAYRGVYKRLISYMKDNKLLNYDESTVVDFVNDYSGTTLKSIYESAPGRAANKSMRPALLLLRYLNTGVVDTSMRKKIVPRVVPDAFLDEYTAFLEECRYRNYAKSTMLTFERFILSFLCYCNEKNVTSANDVDGVIVKGFLAPYYEGHSPKYLATIISSLRIFFSYLYSQQYCNKDCSMYLPISRVTRNAFVPSVWSSGDVKKLLESIDRNNPLGKRDYAMFLLAAKLGLRVSDIRGLNLSDLDWNRKLIRLTMQKTKYPIELPLLDDIGWAIIDYLKMGRPESKSPRLFIRHRAPYDSFGENEGFHRELNDYMKKVGIALPEGQHHGLHALRNTLARNMLENKTPVPVISEVLGHQNSETTSYYIKIDIEGMKRCMIDPEEVFLDDK